MVSAVDWNQFNAGSNPVPIETFSKYRRIELYGLLTHYKFGRSLEKFLIPFDVRSGIKNEYADMRIQTWIFTPGGISLLSCDIYQPGRVYRVADTELVLLILLDL